jgi:hypothetical protein
MKWFNLSRLYYRICDNKGDYFLLKFKMNDGVINGENSE